MDVYDYVERKIRTKTLVAKRCDKCGELIYHHDKNISYAYYEIDIGNIDMDQSDRHITVCPQCLVSVLDDYFGDEIYGSYIKILYDKG